MEKKGPILLQIVVVYIDFYPPPDTNGKQVLLTCTPTTFPRDLPSFGLYMVLYDNILNACGGVAYDQCKFLAGGMTGLLC